ncbi:catechol 2,3-dioxygenase-like lactoylglutathione lyase family enzyme [Catenulispora sp. EB89]|uniref:VOC family protein n=1 Tax=Catenulispora sp. EB89 TaxID=3156257 RepID=UPI0035170A60
MLKWAWSFIDRPERTFEESARFWTAVTGTTLSARRGGREEFATLVPAEGDGDASVKLQGLLSGNGAHIDLEFEDFEAALARAAALGGSVVERDGEWAHVTSPSGYGLCVTAWHGATRVARPFVASDGTRSRLDQVCIDIAPSVHDAEVAFWSDLTGLPVEVSRRWEEFSWLEPMAGFPVGVLFQRIGEERPTAAHLDVSSSDADASRVWHESLGAEFVGEQANWLVMRDPGGGFYCLIRREPES